MSDPIWKVGSRDFQKKKVAQKTVTVAKVMRRMEEKKENNSSINNIGPARTEQGFLKDL